MEPNKSKIKDDISLDPIPKKEELVLISKFQNLPQGPLKERIGIKIIRCNVRFLHKLAVQYARSFNLEEEDLYSQGKLGMWQALHTFDTNKDVKFISYAVWHIRKAFAEVLRTNVPIHHHHTKNTIKNDKFKDFENPLNFKFDSLDKVLFASDGDDITLGESLFDENAIADEDTVKNSRKQKVLTALSMIPEREAQVLSWYFGLGGTALTHTDVSEILGVSKERSRQIRDRGLKLFKKALILIDPDSEDYAIT